jgi:hypothetical protein
LGNEINSVPFTLPKLKSFLCCNAIKKARHADLA